MWICRICHFETALDDVVLIRGDRCICLRCFRRETGSTRPMPMVLRRELITTLLAVETA